MPAAPRHASPSTGKDTQAGGDGTMRLDRWLWHARFYRSRSAACAAVAAGAVRINARRIDRPAQSVRPGDVLTLVLAGRVRLIRIRALPPRRGPAPEAQACYIDLDARDLEAQPDAEDFGPLGA